ncbi:MAG: hypothetical protein JRJ20_06670 [Deltaproteobacteria bacterium]|nr:hypothetical protein [Deltaproteobacteria bacterium]
MKAYGGKEYGVQKMDPREEFEMVSEAHPDVPRNFIIKADVLRRGINFSKEAVEKFQNSPKEYDLVMSILFKWHQTEDALEYTIPFHFHLSDWTSVGIRISPSENRPYLIEVIDEEFYLSWAPGDILTKIYFDGPAKHAGVILENGIPAESICHFGGNQFYMVPMHHCGYWNTGDQCRFCDIDYFAKHMMKMGRGFKTRQTPEDIYMAVCEVLKDEGRYQHCFCNSGTDPREGYKRDLEFTIECIEAIVKAGKDTLGADPFPIYFLSAPQQEDGMQKMYDAGLRSWGSYIETWDENNWPNVCPGKARFMGREEWIKRTVGAVDVFGKGNVAAGFVIGVEMAPPPYGFEDVEDALASTLEGYAFFIDNHVIPIGTQWAIEPGTDFYKMGAKQPTLEFFVRLDKGRYHLLKEYQEKNGFGISADYMDYSQPFGCYADYQRIL